MALLGMFKKNGENGFGYNSTAEQVTEGIDLTGKTYLLTGCTSGLGLETLRVLGLRGGHVIAAARKQADAQQALARTSAEGTPVECDLSQPASVRSAIEAVSRLGRPLDAIICNAGIMALPRLQLHHGFELQFLTNHIGHFVLVNGLQDRLTRAGRIVMVGSDAHRAAPPEGIDFDNLAGERAYKPRAAYGRSKLANILFARELANRFQGTARTACSLHPGVIATNLVRHMNPLIKPVMAAVSPLFLKNVSQGAATQCYVAIRDSVADLSGEYFADCNPTRPSRLAVDAALATALWERSEAIASSIT